MKSQVAINIVINYSIIITSSRLSSDIMTPKSCQVLILIKRIKNIAVTGIRTWAIYRKYIYVYIYIIIFMCTMISQELQVVIICNLVNSMLVVLYQVVGLCASYIFGTDDGYNNKSIALFRFSFVIINVTHAGKVCTCVFHMCVCVHPKL